MSIKKNIFLIDNPRKIKAKHLNKFKLHLTKYGSRVFRSIIYLKVLYRQLETGNSNANVEECHFKCDLAAEKYDE